MSYCPPVLLIDDGELEDVFQTLGDLGVEPARLSGDAAAGDEWFWPTQLLVTTARRGLALDLVSASERSEFTTIAVARDAAQTTQTMLRRVGFDYLVRRPVHPEALRLLLLRAMYGARERRGEPRYPLGFGVTLRRGLRRRPATLTEISESGCRLLARKCVERGIRTSA